MTRYVVDVDETEPVKVILDLHRGGGLVMEGDSLRVTKIELARHLLKDTGYLVIRNPVKDDATPGSDKPEIGRPALHVRTYKGKPLTELSEAELEEARDALEDCVKNAPGFPSAKEYAKDLKHIVNEALRRGLPFVNNYPIVKG